MNPASPLRALTEHTLDALLRTPTPAELKLDVVLSQLARAQGTMDLMAALLRALQDKSPALQTSIERVLALHDQPKVTALDSGAVQVFCERMAGTLRQVQLWLLTSPGAEAQRQAIATVLDDYDATLLNTHFSAKPGTDSDIY